jgi:hypothetical protein
MVEVLAFVANKGNPIIVNPFTRIWLVINASRLLSHSFLEILKLVEIVMVHVPGFVEDKHCFCYVSFLKTKLHNCLDTHLELVVVMFSQFFFTIDNFPY